MAFSVVPHGNNNNNMYSSDVLKSSSIYIKDAVYTVFTTQTSPLNAIRGPESGCRKEADHQAALLEKQSAPALFRVSAEKPRGHASPSDPISLLITVLGILRTRASLCLEFGAVFLYSILVE